ncbi:MAG: pyridoxal phosphate-dependent aminotransferase [Actinobacteria bacterium]|nr:pyridoxal phosphate-dependent aminotransferase [Actinomycetota bacterium]MBO0835005.1 pyridoxal phosphate-dependent aminotransferase [Actinomycetota bacterium]
MPWAGPASLTEPTTPALPPLLGPARDVPVSATLAANEAIARRRRRGEPVLPLAFGESGLPVHPRLTAALADRAGQGAYGPVAGTRQLRVAAAGYWARRGLPTDPEAVVAGPGSKALLFGTLLALGQDVAVPRPSWVSYAAQATLVGVTPHFVPVLPGEGGSCDPDALDQAVLAGKAGGRRIGAVLVTLPDNPTGTLASAQAVRELCAVAERHDLIIISDEIYRDLIHDPAAPFLSPAQVAPHRTVVTTALSKNLSVGGWRIGIARMPDGCAGATLRLRLLGIASEIWSAPAGPVQHAAALALNEPPDLVSRIARSRALHAAVCQEAARLCLKAGLDLALPQAAFYLYPDFAPWRDLLRATFGVRTGADLAELLLHRYGVAALPGSAFGEDPHCLRLRLATGLLYGDTDEQREAALDAPDPLALPWIGAALARFSDVLTDLSG